LKRRIFVIIGAVLVGLSCYLCSRPIINEFRFCSTDDEVYQTIKANLESWKAYFKTLPANEIQVLRFQVSWGGTFVAISRWNGQGDVSPIYVQTIEARQEPFGSSGYAYSANDSSPLDVRYRIDSMGDDIYCYRFK
jgi:hypothetical protein